CYQFKDKHGRVIYVGKAQSLRSRLASYFQAWHLIHARTKAMLETARSVEWIVVDNEVEALHLEYNLIQRHRPRYNVKYRDDKSYPYLVLTTSEEVPRARVKRGKVAKGDRRYGPYAHAYAIRETLDLLLRVFPVRTCSQGVYDRAERTDRPCLYYHIGRCAAPCVGKIDVEEHRELVDGLADFLDGNADRVLEQLEEEMHEAADEQNYEAAARRRDQLFAARKALAKQQMVSSTGEDFDAVALHEDELEAAVQVFFVRRGRLVGRKGWIVDKVEDLSLPELLTSFLLRLYTERDGDVPPQVLVPDQPEDADALGELLAEMRREHHDGPGRPIQRVRFRVPKRGDKRAFMETVAENAKEAFHRNRLKRASDFNARTQALKELQEALDLDEAPLRIECYDISHLGGTEVVGSMVVFEDGLPKKSDYRRFKLSQDKNDDVAAMKEVVRRRVRRLIAEHSDPVDDEGQPRKFAYPPNLVVIDGGVGQLNAALDAVAELADEHGEDPLIGDVEFVALAKRFEELWRPDTASPTVLPRGSDALYLVQRVRDEAHRFAVAYQRKRRRKAVRGSELEDIPGVGPTRRKRLLRHFGSVKAIRGATVEELTEVDGISHTIAETVHTHLTTAAREQESA
ncbi:MAG: excinuclease ABC subunit UvrC, partial [Nitriliruptorales bacterium]|nr:excinuclease ABC subunit UvrC [Nitriliruptorales bacterium]